MRFPPALSAAVAAGSTVLAPNTELAAALFDALEREHRARGQEFWPTPKVRDFGSWLREQQERAHLEDAKVPRPLSDIEERELWRQVIEGSLFSQNLLEVGVAARAAARARRLMLDYAIPWNKVLAESSDESQAFYEWHREFEARCRSMSLGLPAALPPATSAAHSLAWIDSPAWRPVVRQWLTRHAQRIAPQALPVIRQQELPGIEQQVVHHPSAERELAAVARWARHGLESVPEFRAWILMPDLARRRPEIAAAFDAELAPGRFSLSNSRAAAAYALAGGSALAEYASVRAALDFLDAAIGMLSFSKFSALLRAPWLQDSPRDASAAALLDVKLREHGPHEARLGGWLALCEELTRRQELAAPAAVTRLWGALETLEASASNQRLSDWIPLWLEVFKQAPWVGRERWSSSEFQAAERLRELLGSLARADVFFGMQSRAAAVRLLTRAVNEVAFQPQTGVPPIWVSGQWLDPFLSYDALWVCGMSAAQWPPPQQPVSLLPVRVQRAYGVLGADAKTQLDHAQLLQSAWRARAPRCFFSYSDSGDGQSAAPSALLGSGPVEEAAPVTVRPHWQRLSQNPALEEFLDALAPPFADWERTHGVATLKAQSRCAFRGFAESRLAAQPLEQPVPGFSQRERGELVHDALEYLWSQLHDQATLLRLEASARQALLAEATRRAINGVCRRRNPGARWREREQQRLVILLEKWLKVEEQRSPFRVLALEQAGQIAVFGGLEYSVRIDRQDVLDDGGRVVIDYKTGSAPKDWRGERPDNPQLPVYALLKPEKLVAVAYGRVNAADSEFVFESARGDVFKAGGRPSNRADVLEGEPDFAALIEVWRGRIEAIAAAFAAGEAAVAPTPTACRWCALDGLCRIPSLNEPEPFDE